MGVSFAANITSDQTGIGNWPEDNFTSVLKLGKFKGMVGGGLLLPPLFVLIFGFENLI